MPEIDSLLDAVEQLWECITLCRTNQIPERMEQFNQAVEQASVCGDPLMCALLPAFRKKFGKRLTIPGLIKWCVQSDMLQQALTIYKERIPTYLMVERPDILHVPAGMPPPEMRKDYVSEEEARFYEHFLKMGRNMEKAYYGRSGTPGEGWKDYTVTTLERLEEFLPHSYFTTQYPIERLRVIVMDYLYIRALRNMTNHAQRPGDGFPAAADDLPERLWLPAAGRGSGPGHRRSNPAGAGAPAAADKKGACQMKKFITVVPFQIKANWAAISTGRSATAGCRWRKRPVSRS